MRTILFFVVVYTFALQLSSRTPVVVYDLAVTPVSLRTMGQMADSILVTKRFTIDALTLSINELIEHLQFFPHLSRRAIVVLKGEHLCTRDFSRLISHLATLVDLTKRRQNVLEIPLACYEIITKKEKLQDALANSGFTLIVGSSH